MYNQIETKLSNFIRFGEVEKRVTEINSQTSVVEFRNEENFLQQQQDKKKKKKKKKMKNKIKKKKK